MGTVDFSAEYMDAFASLPDGDQPVLMLNLLRYRPHADYQGRPEQTSCSGRAAYRRYAALVMPLLEKAGATVRLMGRWQATLIGGSAESWDDMLLVQYPNRGAFLEMLRSPAYQAIAFHRQSALADSRLIAFQPDSAAFQDRPREASA